MGAVPIETTQAQLWRLSPDRRSVRLRLPPLRLVGREKPVDIHLDFDAEAVDEILQRLTELRMQMVPPPVWQ
jgi:hypothetical protein